MMYPSRLLIVDVLFCFMIMSRNWLLRLPSDLLWQGRFSHEGQGLTLLKIVQSKGNRPCFSSKVYGISPLFSFVLLNTLAKGQCPFLFINFNPLLVFIPLDHRNFKCTHAVIGFLPLVQLLVIACKDLMLTCHKIEV